MRDWYHWTVTSLHGEGTGITKLSQPSLHYEGLVSLNCQKSIVIARNWYHWTVTSLHCEGVVSPNCHKSTLCGTCMVTELSQVYTGRDWYHWTARSLHLEKLVSSRTVTSLHYEGLVSWLNCHKSSLRGTGIVAELSQVYIDTTGDRNINWDKFARVGVKLSQIW